MWESSATFGFLVWCKCGHLVLAGLRTSTYACMPHHTGRIVVSYKNHIAMYNAFMLVIVFLEFILVSGAKAERFSYWFICSIL
jgi:hypothetical protein